MCKRDAQGVANVSWALGKLGHFSHAALEGAARAYCRAPHAYKPQEACNLLWAMTQHRYHPQEALGVVVRSLVKGAAQLRPADHAMLFRALGTFGVHPGNQLLSELLNPMGKQLARFSTVELCTVYWALGLIVSAAWGKGAWQRAAQRAQPSPSSGAVCRDGSGLKERVRVLAVQRRGSRASR